MARKMIIDTDTASDDAVAILMALQHPDIEVAAITVVSGNVSMTQSSINARYTVERCGKRTPVYEGAATPLIREIAHATFFHGQDGMGNMYYPAPQAAPAPGHAAASANTTIVWRAVSRVPAMALNTQWRAAVERTTPDDAVRSASPPDSGHTQLTLRACTRKSVPE